MAAQWTKEQTEAIYLRNCNILVSAAAGSGKTAVLVERIYAMLTDEERPLDIDQLLVVTFTNAAAAEMKERVEERLAQSLENDPDNVHVARQIAAIHSAQIMTIHSFCLYVIRTHFNDIDLDPAFRIGEETELKLMRGDVLERLMETYYEKEDEAFLQFVECFAKGKMDHGIEELILQVYEYSRSYPDPEGWLSSCLESFLVENGRDLEKLPSVEFLMDYIKKILGELDRALEEGLALCGAPDGPVYYGDALAQDQKLVRQLMECQSFDEYYHGFSALSFARLSSKKMPDADEEKKNQVKNIRAFVKDTLSDLKKDFFGADSEKSAESLRRMLPHMEMLVTLTQDFAREYQAAKEEKNMVDFGDLEHFALKILTREEKGEWMPTQAAQDLSRQYEEILIDEYQDSNQVQETILTSISREQSGHPNVFMVGDVKQSIYKFRLARPQLFMEKYLNYPHMGEKYQCIRLHKNFRSRPAVLDCVNYIFRHLMGEDLGDIEYDDDAALYAGAVFPIPETEEMDYGKNEEVMLVIPEDGWPGPKEGDTQEMTEREIEALAVARRIREMVQGDNPLYVTDKGTGKFRPAGYGDIVILLRTMSGWADTFVKILGEENIPVQAETVTGFFSTIEISTVLSWLNIIDNPLQDIPMAAVLKSPTVGLSDEEMAMVASVSGGNKRKRPCLYDCCRSVVSHGETAGFFGDFAPKDLEALLGKLKKFVDLLNCLRAEAAYTPVHELLLKVYDNTGYYAYACAMPGGQKRRANLDMLVEKAVAYEKTSYRGLFNFTRYIARLRQYEVDFGEAGAGAAPSTVRIMSIHKSKGLEYPVVFVAGLGKSFNQQDARSALIIHSDLGFGPDVVDTHLRLKAPTLQKKILAKKTVLENLGEELRVLYVAMTRAREKLVLCGYVRDLEKSVERWQSGGADMGRPLLSFRSRQGARSYLDWIMAALISHRCCHSLLESFRKKSPIFHPDYESPAPFVLRIMGLGEIFYHLGAESVNAYFTREMFEHWDCDRVYVQPMHEAMGRYLSWVYPYTGGLALHTKMTVSELKSIGQMPLDEDEETAWDLWQETPQTAVSGEAAVSALPTETADGEAPGGEGGFGNTTAVRERMVRAALRGTTVHKILEAMDIASIGSVRDVDRLIEKLLSEGRVDPEGAKLVYVPGIYNFARSSIARRMAKAQKDHCLYREKQFVIGVLPSVIDPSAADLTGDDSDTILIQGIIDAWFIEDGQAVLVDYKTDYVADDGESLVKKYKTQLDYYELALEQITGLKVKEKIIYALSIGREIRV
ncbi:ATP-dependent helicase/nuclease subunit A [Catenibacillus scindens]|uniref:ATP-dependent helicase/nuclease subunit A n=1 Tax=Catenibacillus scindens TaxID=673271 RepID=A0A7W8HC96_9FIRM|nr:helicase-exonuclease AddAB subunit AddA [Catenibacillus scindens]MBB5265723.1 ATP-dependent helicase/nuclease subunit A [Catenibacillus scindens]